MNNKSLKERIIECLKNGSKMDNELYNEAFSLYRESENKDQNQERVYNLGFTDMNLKNLLYDLQKINGVSDLEIAKAKMEVVKNVEEIEVNNSEDLGVSATNTEAVPASTEVNPAITEPEGDTEKVESGELGKGKKNLEIDETAENTEKSDVKQEADEVKEGNLVDETTNNTEDSESSTEITGDGTGVAAPELVTESPETFKADPSEQERAILRNDYPFLSDKNCPDELKVLVADKITAFKNYTEAHAKLVKHSNGELELSEEELKQVTKDSVENFEANRDIFKELDYYKAQGKILGEHPIFRELTLQREVDAMSNKERVNYLNSSKKFISVKTKELELLVEKKGKGYKEKMVSLNAEISARQEKLALVKTKLEINE